MQFSSIFNGFAKNMTMKNGRKNKADTGREAADALAKTARKNELLLSSSGCVKSNGSNNFASVYSKGGKKGINQDSVVVWEEFGSQEDVIFCGVYDGHGPWGHLVSKKVREIMPSSFLCNWQETLALMDDDVDCESDGCLNHFEIWKKSYLNTCSAVDDELQQHSGIDSFYSGTTALTIVRQGDLIVLANVGDSRAVLATTYNDGSLIPVQLTVDHKPNLPQESERIKRSNGRVCSARDEPGLYRIWMPSGESALQGPGLAISRAFGDFFVKDFGLTSEPQVTQRYLTSRDQFIILATDGVWDVLSNEEAIEIVASTPKREDSAKRLAECAARAWKLKKRGFATDDISAICLFFHPV